MGYRLGVDVGGTFTDLVQVNDETGAFYRAKTSSTPSDPSQGVLEGLRRICRTNNIRPEEITHILHGTTVATNAVLEGKGARVGLLTTEGFREILHLARSQTPGPLAGWIIMVKTTAQRHLYGRVPYPLKASSRWVVQCRSQTACLY